MKNNYSFISNDGGRSLSKRPNESRDCSVRALAIATNSDYDAIYDLLHSYGRKKNTGFKFRSFIEKIKFVNGYSFVWISFPARKGEKRMTISNFCENFNSGTYIVRTARHVIAIIDGVVNDSWMQRDNRCVYGCWKISIYHNL